MTTPNEAAEAIYARFEANIGDTPFTYENEDLDAPDGWVRLSIRHNGRRQETMGRATNRRFESRGSIFAQCYGRTNLGRQGVDALALTVANIFEAQSFNGVNTFEATPREQPPDGKWFWIEVEIVFAYYERK